MRRLVLRFPIASCATGPLTNVRRRAGHVQPHVVGARHGPCWLWTCVAKCNSCSVVQRSRCGRIPRWLSGRRGERIARLSCVISVWLSLLVLQASAVRDHAGPPRLSSGTELRNPFTNTVAAGSRRPYTPPRSSSLRDPWAHEHAHRLRAFIPVLSDLADPFEEPLGERALATRSAVIISRPSDLRDPFASLSPGAVPFRVLQRQRSEHKDPFEQRRLWLRGV